MDYTDLVKKLRERNGWALNETLDAAADAIEALQRNLNDCRNELCLYCGQYKQRHKGACDGCRWMPKEGAE